MSTLRLRLTGRTKCYTLDFCAVRRRRQHGKGKNDAAACLADARSRTSQLVNFEAHLISPAAKTRPHLPLGPLSPSSRFFFFFSPGAEKESC